MEAAVTMSMPMNNGLGMTMQRGVLRNRGLVNDGRNSWLSVQRVVGMRKVGRVLAVHIGKELKERRPQNVAGEGRVLRRETPPHDIKEDQKTLPLPINEQRIPGIYHCGFHSEKSFAATSYFIVHPEGNILVDSPRYTEALASNLELLGGVRFMFLSHKGDIADHEKWSKRLNCERILHSTEVQESTFGVERKLEGTGPWSLWPDIDLIHTPGHTEGSVCLYHKPLKVLLTGRSSSLVGFWTIHLADV